MMRRIDLLPSHYAERRKERRNFGLVILGGLAVFILLLAYWMLLGTQVTDAENELAEVEAQNNEIRSEIAQLQNFANLQRELDEKRAALAAVMAGDVDWPEVLTEVALVTPTDVWFTQVSASAAGTEGETPVPTEQADIRVSQVAPAGRISFQGRALDMPAIAKFMLRLDDTRSFTSVYLNNAIEEEIEGRFVIGFDNSVEMTQKVLSQRFADGQAP